MGSIRYTFDEVKLREEFRVRCPRCRKTRKKVLTDGYFRNGLHDEAETRSRKTAELRARRVEMERDGLLCWKCGSA